MPTYSPRWQQTLRRRWILTILFVAGAFVIIGVVLVYTQRLVDTLIAREQRLVRFYADILQSFATANSIESLFLLEQVTPTIDFPCVITDSNSRPLEPYEKFTLNVALEMLQNDSAKHKYLEELVVAMGGQYPPVEVRDTRGRVVNYIYYTNSWVVRHLRILPYAEIAIVALFIAAGYVALALVRRHEESLIWIGMAKETAHQLGTPLSSMLGWLEVLKELELPSPSQRALSELTRDIERLLGIAQRFSMIGSQPQRKPVDLCQLIEHTICYMQPRLPRHGRTITVQFHCAAPCVVAVNEELISWVLENLIKNAAEAIVKHSGSITITVKQHDDIKSTFVPQLFMSKRKQPYVRICVTDDGRGMSASVRRYIFMPGFTTKERGWGLGLSLAKRIVEEYHQGRISILHSAPDQGTTIAVDLPKSDV